MTDKLRLKKHDLKRNEMALLLGRLVEWFESHKKEVEYALWGVFVFIILVVGSVFIYKKKQNESIVSFSNALGLYKAKSYTNALLAFNKLPDSFEKEKIFYTSSINFEKGKYDEAKNGYESFFKKYPKSEWATRALWNLGQIQEHLGNLKKAEEIYSDGINKYKDSSSYDIFRLSLADVKARIGDIDTSESIYKDIEKDYESLKDRSAIYNYVEDKLFMLKIKRDESKLQEPDTKEPLVEEK